MFHMFKGAGWDRNYQMNPTKVMSDFESGLVASIALQFPGAKHKGCYYHQQFQSLGYQTYYLNDERMILFMREMIALAFLPEWEIEIAFQLLCEDKPSDLDIDQFIQYMDGTWIN